MDNFAEDFDKVLADLYEFHEDGIETDEEPGYFQRKQELETVDEEESLREPPATAPKGDMHDCMAKSSKGTLTDVMEASKRHGARRSKAIFGEVNDRKERAELAVETTNDMDAQGLINSPSCHSIESTYDAIRSIEKSLAKQKKAERKGIHQIENELKSVREEIAQLANAIQHTVSQQQELHNNSSKRGKNRLKSLMHALNVRKRLASPSKE